MRQLQRDKTLNMYNTFKKEWALLYVQLLHCLGIIWWFNGHLQDRSEFRFRKITEWSAQFLSCITYWFFIITHNSLLWIIPTPMTSGPLLTLKSEMTGLTLNNSSRGFCTAIPLAKYYKFVEANIHSIYAKH